MGSEREKAMSATAVGDIYGKDGTEAHVQELIRARRAALNLMEDAVLAKRRADELIVQLRDQMKARASAEGELRESRERLQLLSESFQDYAIFTTDPAGNVLTWNPGA